MAAATTNASAAATTAPRSVATPCDRSSVPGTWRRARLRDRAMHFPCCRSGRCTTAVWAAGFRLTVPPTVFHPQSFLTSEFLASFVAGLDLAGRRVADVGTGTGILALAAARAGAASVLAIDINPRAVQAATENAIVNGLDGKVTSICSDLLSGVATGVQLDMILSNPPFFAGEPLDLADRAWHAGPDCRDIAPLFEQARAHLAPSGVMYVVLSSHSDLDLFGTMIAHAGLRSRVAAERSIVVGRLIIYQLQAA